MDTRSITYKVPYPMVRVEWVDSSTLHGWNHLDKEPQAFNLRCVTAGLLIQETPDYLCLVDSVSLEDDGSVSNGHCLQQIPRAAVIRIAYLTEKRK